MGLHREQRRCFGDLVWAAGLAWLLASAGGCSGGGAGGEMDGLAAGSGGSSVPADDGSIDGRGSGGDGTGDAEPDRGVAGGDGDGESASGGTDAGNGGSGGSSGAEPPPPPPGSSALPDDPSLFGDNVLAMYLFREPYVTLAGSPPVVTSVMNAHAPGNADIAFDSPPLWLEDCGRDASGANYGCARFDEEDQGTGSGFAIETGDRPSLVAVLKFNEVADLTSTPITLRNTSGVNEFMNLAQVRTQGTNLWRYNGHYVQTPHNIDFGSPDLDLHLHESHLASPSTLAIFDGVVQGTGADAVIVGPLTTIALGRGLRDQGSQVDMFEVLVIDQPSTEQADAYRAQRIAYEYPTIALP